MQPPPTHRGLFMSMVLQEAAPMSRAAPLRLKSAT